MDFFLEMIQNSEKKNLAFSNACVKYKVSGLLLFPKHGKLHLHSSVKQQMSQSYGGNTKYPKFASHM